MESQHCLKVIHRGMLRFIIYEANQRYEDILRIATECFAIPAEYRKALLISNEHGYIFDKQLFNYFLLLFPNPEMIFHIRFDYNRMSHLKNQPECRTPLGKSNANQQCDTEAAYAAAPVRRQNCFLGALPTTTAERYRDDEFAKQVSRRIHAMEAKRRMKRMRSTPKRSLRV